MNEYECTCGYTWIDDHNYGCPMCSKQDDVIRRDYVIKQPREYGSKYERM